MWPTELYRTTERSALDSIAPQLVDHGAIETIQALPPLARGAVGAVATVLVAALVLGLLQEYGPRSVATSRRSPIISLCIGLPALFVVGLVTGVGVLIIDMPIGVFFGVILVSLGAVILPVACAIGLVAAGQSIVARTGSDRLWLGVIVAGLIGGVGTAVAPLGLAVGTIATAFGLGAGARLLIGSGGGSTATERTVPPANKT